jgi:5-methyltetrahydrofolate--homocysteine methyltransferase
MEVFETIKQECIEGKRTELLRDVNAALVNGTDAGEIMTRALIPAMSVVGERYSTGEYFLPQMMIGARAMTEAMQLLEPHLAGGTYKKKAKAVLGTVAGDVHDIGKNIVKVMMEGSGYEVVDLGVDVSSDSFLEAIHREAPRFVLLSALLTLTMENMRETVRSIARAGMRGDVIIGIGGAPATQEFADEIGADFYGADAYDCVAKSDGLLGREPQVAR